MSAQLALAFDYGTLDSETRIVVQQRTIEIKALMRRSAQDIIEIGQKLIDVKARLGHGAFGGWLASEFEWSERTARNFMQVADAFKSATVADLIPAKALYLLAAPSTPETARVEALDRAEMGEPITYSVAREIIATHKPPQRPYTVSSEIAPSDEYDPQPDNDVVFIDPVADEMEERRVTRFNEGMRSSDTPEWYTPLHIIERVIKVFGHIDLDPCSNSDDPDVANVPARRYFTQATDGLAQQWFGRVYMNPPYGDEIPPWAKKIADSWNDGHIIGGIALLPARTDTAWFQDNLARFPMCFLRGRLKFSGADNSAPFPSVVVYIGDDYPVFADVFGDLGFIK